MFYIKLDNIEQRSRMIKFLKDDEVYSAFHYVPLHSSDAGMKYGRFCGEDRFTTKESERLLRLPMYYSMGKDNVMEVVDRVNKFFVR